MIVSGGFVSMPLNVCCAGVGSSRPARSIARTSNVYRPSSSSSVCQPLEQDWKISIGSIASNGLCGSGASVRSCSISRHS